MKHFTKTAAVLKWTARFLLFPYWDADELPTLIGCSVHITLIVVTGYQWFSPEPLSGKVALFIFTICAVIYLFGYGLYRDPGFRGWLSRSWD